MQKHTQTNRRPETSEKEAKRDFFFKRRQGVTRDISKQEKHISCVFIASEDDAKRRKTQITSN